MTPQRRKRKKPKGKVSFQEGFLQGPLMDREEREKLDAMHPKIPGPGIDGATYMGLSVSVRKRVGSVMKERARRARAYILGEVEESDL